MFDAHLHLQDPRLDGLREAVLERTETAGISTLCTCATSPEDWDATERLAAPDTTPRILIALGVHPWYAKGLPDNWRDALRERLLRNPDMTVGEAGLDGLGKGPSLDIQRPVLEAQLALAVEMQRPIVLHGARAWAALYECCKPYAGKIPAMLLHSFSGSPEQLRDWVRLGAYFSFGGSICNHASTRLRALPHLVPEDRLLAETDSPDMLPCDGEPIRPGTRLNEPANLPLVIREIASLRDADPNSIGQITETNARRFFRMV